MTVVKGGKEGESSSFRTILAGIIGLDTEHVVQVSSLKLSYQSFELCCKRACQGPFLHKTQD